MRFARLSTQNGVVFARLEGERAEWLDGAPWLRTGSPFGAPWLEARAREGGTWSEAELLCPVVPSKIVCVGRNYAAHARELGNEPPREPLLFLKPPSSLVGPGESIVLPTASSRVEHEAELGVVIGRKARDV